MGGGLSPWPYEVHVFAHDELESPGEGRFHGGDIDFAVALPGMSVTGLEERTGCMDGKVESGPGDQFFVVQIAAVNPWRTAVNAARGGGRRNAHAAEEWPQGNLDSLVEDADHALTVETDQFGAVVREVVGQIALGGPEIVLCVGQVQVNFLNSHFEDVAGLGTFYIDWPGKPVTAWSGVARAVADDFEVGGNFCLGHAERFGSEGVAHGLDGDGVARHNAEHRFRLGRVVAVGDGVGGGFQIVVGRLGGEGGGAEEEQNPHGTHYSVGVFADKSAATRPTRCRELSLSAWS